MYYLDMHPILDSAPINPIQAFFSVKNIKSYYGCKEVGETCQ